jgi:2,3,4,5-tetrahydropyridine-2,6-dicarboxylate N-succinyltransferase
MTQDNLQATIDAAWENRANLSTASAPRDVLDAVEHTIEQLNNGKLRVATRQSVGVWTTHQWIKKAVLLSFRLKDNEVMRAGDFGFYDKVPTKFAHLSEEEMRASGVRVVPPAVARRGCFIAKGAILMPSYVNIGAYVDEGTMVDTWAAVGSCAQIGKNVHLSGGVGIGGVLEPMQANPTIIEDNCFIGARSEIVEGVIHGRVHRPEHTDLRPRAGHRKLRPHSGRLRRGVGQPAQGGWQIQPVLRGDRQACRCQNARHHEPK